MLESVLAIGLFLIACLYLFFELGRLRVSKDGEAESYDAFKAQWFILGLRIVSLLLAFLSIPALFWFAMQSGTVSTLNQTISYDNFTQIKNLSASNSTEVSNVQFATAINTTQLVAPSGAEVNALVSIYSGSLSVFLLLSGLFVVALLWAIAKEMQNAWKKKRIGEWD